MAEMADARRPDLHRRRHRRAGRPADAPGARVRRRASGVTLAQHCETTSLSEGTCMHEGEWSSRLGLPGQPSEAEELMVMRDIALARLTGARMHFLHLSTAGSVAMVAAARAGGPADHRRGGPAPLHADRRVLRRLRRDLQGPPAAANRGRRRGDQAWPGRRAIDAIATDHAPHAPEEKERPFDQAPAGDAGSRVRAGAGLHRAGRRRHRHDRGRRAGPAVVAARRDRGHGTTTADRSSRVGPANLCVIDPDGALDDRRQRRGVAESQRALRRARGSRQGPPHVLLRGHPW